MSRSVQREEAFDKETDSIVVYRVDSRLISSLKRYGITGCRGCELPFVEGDAVLKSNANGARYCQGCFVEKGFAEAAVVERVILRLDVEALKARKTRLADRIGSMKDERRRVDAAILGAEDEFRDLELRIGELRAKYLVAPRQTGGSPSRRRS